VTPHSRRRIERGEAPAGYDAAGHPIFAVTVDIVVLTVRAHALHVLLIRRGADPFAGVWALPGGFKSPGETLDAAAARELREETAVRAPSRLAQFGAYGDPGRDPRTNVVTVAYLAATPAIDEVAAGTDAADARVVPVAGALRGRPALAFDHGRILRDAVERTARDLELTDLAPAFLQARFTLTELQEVFEAVWGIELDPANFRRSLTSDPERAYVIGTGERAASSERGGRPPELFRAGPAWKTGSPIRRPAR
jgi:8-oxo-dGTP diphosphatase